MKRRNREAEDTGTWMNTYSDLVTLLLTFFVLLYSFSSVDSEKWEAFVKAFGTPGEIQIIITGRDGSCLKIKQDISGIPFFRVKQSP